MYILIVYHDMDHILINCIYIFSYFKDIIKFTNNIINYQDKRLKIYKYKSIKRFFEVKEII